MLRRLLRHAPLPRRFQPFLPLGLLTVLCIAGGTALAQTTVPSAPTKLTVSADSCPTGQIGAPPGCFPLPPAPVAGGKRWTAVYSEEFSGAALDTTKLTPCFDWNFGACTASFNA